MSSPIRDALHFPESSRSFLEPHLPQTKGSQNPRNSHYPFTTLTFATSLDSSISLSPGTQTALSGAETKALTHYLRSRHDAILIGVGTAIADNPSLNCRLEGVGGYGGEGLTGQPQPVIVDPRMRFSLRFSPAEEEFREGKGELCKLLQLVKQGRGKAPWIITAIPPQKLLFHQTDPLERLGGKFIYVKPIEENSYHLDWKDILAALSDEGIQSVMIEGGGAVINSLLHPKHLTLIDSIIVTIAPVWLGQGGVVVSPERRVDEEGNAIAALRLKDVEWKQFGQDVVMCGKITD